MDGQYGLFPTAIGSVGLAWTSHGIAGVQIPAESDEATRRRLRGRFPEAAESSEPPLFVAEALEAIRSLLAGERTSLAAIPLDLSGPSDFERRVYEIASTIPADETMSYGEVAAALGEPRAAREVGAALGRNPVPIIVPCHRVLAADGRPGGFSAPGGVETKLKLLAIEGAVPGNQFDLFGPASR